MGKSSVWAERHSKTSVSWCQAEVWGEPLVGQEIVNSCKEEQHLWALRSSQVVLEASGFQTWSLVLAVIISVLLRGILPLIQPGWARGFRY